MGRRRQYRESARTNPAPEIRAWFRVRLRQQVRDGIRDSARWSPLEGILPDRFQRRVRIARSRRITSESPTPTLQLHSRRNEVRSLLPRQLLLPLRGYTAETLKLAWTHIEKRPTVAEANSDAIIRIIGRHRLGSQVVSYGSRLRAYSFNH